MQNLFLGKRPSVLNLSHFPALQVQRSRNRMFDMARAPESVIRAT